MSCALDLGRNCKRGFICVPVVITARMTSEVRMHLDIPIMKLYYLKIAKLLAGVGSASVRGKLAHCTLSVRGRQQKPRT